MADRGEGGMLIVVTPLSITKLTHVLLKTLYTCSCLIQIMKPYYDILFYLLSKDTGVYVGYRMLNNEEEKPDQKLTVGLSSAYLYLLLNC